MNKRPITIIDAIRHKQLFGSLPAFSSLTTWVGWLAWLKAVFALGMDEQRARHLPPMHGQERAAD